MAFQLCDNYFRDPEAEKAVVECRLLSSVVRGQKVAIVPYDHPDPKFNNSQCLTGEVLEYTEDKNQIVNGFETIATKYVVT